MTSPFALVIEDDPDLSEIFAKALTDVGYTAEIIEDGQVALERIKQDPGIYLVILDLHLPHVSGETILKEMKNNPGLEKTRLIITTADAFMAEILRDKADLVLVKPVSYRQLRDLVQRFLPR